MILQRPTYESADTFEDWVHKNLKALSVYWCDCDEAIRKGGGPGAPVGDWEYFVQSQFDSWQRDNLVDYDDYNNRLSNFDDEDDPDDA